MARLPTALLRAAIALSWMLPLGLCQRELRAQTPNKGSAAGTSADEGLADLEDLLETRVETTIASKTAESVEEAPSIVTVVTDVEIRRWGYRSVGEVLEHVVGFYLLDDHTIPNLLVRGIGSGLGGESGLIKVMLDGHSAAYRYTGGNWLGVELVPLSMVERIEIVRGPASSLYGADALLGAVNIVTRAPKTGFEGTVSGSVGMTGTEPGGRYDVAVGSQHKGWSLLVGVAGENIDRSGLMLPSTSPAPIVPSYHQGDDTARGLGRASQVWMIKGGYRYHQQAEITAYAWGSVLSRGGDFSRWAQLVDGTDAAGRHYQTRVALSQNRFGLGAHLGNPESLDLTLGVHFFSGGPRPSDRIEVASDLYTVRRRNSYAGEWGQLEARWKLLGSLRAVAGAEVVLERQRLETPLRISKLNGQSLETASTEPDRVVSLLNPGSYLQLHWDPFARFLKLVGGLRYDHHTVYGSQFSQRLAAISQLTNRIYVKALYGNAFMAPSPQLLYAEPLRPGDIIGNEQLRPQYVNTYEFQLGYQPQRYLTLSSNLAFSRLRDKAEFVPQGINKAAQNITSVTSISWETMAELRYRDLVNGYLGFELIDARRETGDLGYQAQLVGSRYGVYPPWIVRGGISVQAPIPNYPVEISNQGRWVAPRWASADNTFERGAPYQLPMTVLWDVTVAVSTHELWADRLSTARVSAYNLLGSKGPDPGFGGIDYPLAPREIMLVLRQEI